MPINPSKLLTDPTRFRVYALLPDDNSVAVIDTTTLTVTTTIPVGQDPVDMSLSLDRGTLYVANHYSAQETVGIRHPVATAISAIDLGTLTVRATFALPDQPISVAAGLDGRVYASTNFQLQPVLYQFDGATGTVQTQFYPNFSTASTLQITPDGKTLFFANGDESLITIQSFDVSTPTPAAAQTLSDVSADSSELLVSNTGKYIFLPYYPPNGNFAAHYSYLFSTANFTQALVELQSDATPGLLAFGPDDSLAYQVSDVFQAPSIEVFDTGTQAKLHEAVLPAIDTIDHGDEYNAMAIDGTGSYVFITDSDFNGIDTTGRVLVLSTGVAALPLPLPTVSISATSATGGYGPQSVTFFRTGDLTKKLFADYAIKGSARNGEDYETLGGRFKFKPGKATATIQVIPTDAVTHYPSRTVKLKLLPEATYRVGSPARVKVKIQSTSTE